jgi:DNA-binding NarL/FixJ family response regulator
VSFANGSGNGEGRNGRTTRVLVVDDNRLVREGVAQLLASELDMSVVGTTADGTSALRMVETERPDIVLVDASLPDKHGITLAREVSQRFPGVKVVTLGVTEIPAEVTEAIEAGAAGYVPKDASVSEFREILRAVAQGRAHCAPHIAATLFSRLAELASTRRAREVAGSVKLTPREVQILALVAEGLTNKEIAVRLHVETQTVKNHMHNILEKLELRHRLQAVQYATEAGLLRMRTR